MDVLSVMSRSIPNPRICATSVLLRARERGLADCDVTGALSDYGAAAKRGGVGVDKESKRYWSVMMPLLAKVRAEFERQRSAFAGSAAVEGLEQIVPLTVQWGVTSQDLGPQNPDDRFNGPSMVFTDSSLKHFWVLSPGCDDDGSHVCAEVLAKSHFRADALFCLLTYLGLSPRFVRFFVFDERAKLPRDLLRFDAAPARARPDRVDSSPERYGEVSADQYRPVSATTSSSRMTILPRIMVAIGQAVASKPSNGVQPERVAICSWVMVRLAFISTMVRSASKPSATRPLSAKPKTRCTP